MFKINLIVFLISLFIGFMIVYITNPPYQLVIKYPNPYNSENTIYKDINKDTCFIYKSYITKCINSI
jgi:hypothetical protein